MAEDRYTSSHTGEEIDSAVTMAVAHEERINNVEGDVGDHEDRITVLENSNSSLKTSVSDHTTRIAAAESKNTTQDTQIAALESLTADVKAALVGQVTLTPSEVLASSVIVRDTSGSVKRGDIAAVSSAKMSVRVYSVSAGQSITIAFSDNIPTSTSSQCCGWYTTADTAQMSSATFKAVSGANAYSKYIIGQTVTATVPDGVVALAVSCYQGAEEVVSMESASGRIDALRQEVAAQETRLAAAETEVAAVEEALIEFEEDVADLDSRVAIVEDSMTIDDGTTPAAAHDFGAGYMLVSTAISGDGTNYFPAGASFTKGDVVLTQWTTYKVRVYATSAGDVWRISVGSGGSTAGARLWATYNGDEAGAIGSANLVDMAPSSQRVRDVASSTDGYIDLTIGTGVKLAVQDVANAVTARRLVASVGAAVEDCMSRVAAVEQRCDTDEQVIEKLSATAARLAFRRVNDLFYVAIPDGIGHELVYLFDFCLPSNNTYSMRCVGWRDALRNYPIAPSTWTGVGLHLLAAQTSTDLIGPISIVGYADFLGGAHGLSYATGGMTATPTSQTQSVTITADDNAVAAGAAGYCVKAEVVVVNVIGRPDDSVLNADGKVTQQLTYGDLLPLCTETITLTVTAAGLRVHVKHEFSSKSVGKAIKTYYGMQSAYFDRTASGVPAQRATTMAVTPDGKFPHAIAESGFSSFKKADYPLFNRLLQRIPSGWIQSMWLNPYVGIGDHSLLADTDSIFVDGGNSTKMYHKLISSGTAITSGFAYEWEGVYKWEFDNGPAPATDFYA